MGKRKRPSLPAHDDDPLIGQTFFFEPEPEEQPARGGLGSQCLPVAELEEDYAGVPEDAEIYLGWVRKEAAGLLDIVSIARSYPTSPPSATKLLQPPPKAHVQRPDDAWRTSFEGSFKRMRKAIRDAGEAPSLPELADFPVPDAEDEAAWRAYIYDVSPVDIEETNASAQTGTEGSDKPMSASQARRAPDLTVLSLMDQGTALSLLEHFDSWISTRLDRVVSGPSTAFLPPALRKKALAAAKASANSAPPAFDAHDAQWLFATLAVLDDLLAGDEIDRLRRLARTCLAVLAATPEATADVDAKAGCWMVVAAVAGVWGQRDLWEET